MHSSLTDGWATLLERMELDVGGISQFGKTPLSVCSSTMTMTFCGVIPRVASSSRVLAISTSARVASCNALGIRQPSFGHHAKLRKAFKHCSCWLTACLLSKHRHRSQDRRSHQ